MPEGGLEPRRCGEVARALSSLWVVSVMAPEVGEELERLGLEPGERYFPQRAAPLGAASAELVVATFFNFSPATVGAVIPGAWAKATPAQVLAAQQTGVQRALQRALVDADEGVVHESLDLLRAAAEAARERPEGRPLFAACASLAWPDDPLAALWHAQYLLREFRGDGHIAVLVAEGLTGIEALAIHIAAVPALEQVFRRSRGWSDDAWSPALTRLHADGWLTDDRAGLTPAGRERRARIEERTDELDLPAYAAIGTRGVERLLELAPPLRSALEQAGLGFAGRP
jgi:hypothetical protein